MARWWIGTSGWQYDHWRGLYYPRDVPVRDWFERYARDFDTVEINNSFYRLPEAHTFRAWERQAAPGFLYAIKYSQFGSHKKKLKDPWMHVPRFLERAVHLRRNFGPVLVQLPPRWRAHPERLDAFLQHCAETPGGRERRWAIEFREPSWLCEEVYEVLERHGAALVIHDHIAGHPHRFTSDWTYLRFHGKTADGSYDRAALDRIARLIESEVEADHDVYAYFNNDWHGYALWNAFDLKKILRGQPVGAGSTTGTRSP